MNRSTSRIAITACALVILSTLLLSLAGGRRQAVEQDEHEASPRMAASADASELPPRRQSEIGRILTVIADDNDAPPDVRRRAETALDRSRGTSRPILVRVMLYDWPVGVITDKYPMLHVIAIDQNADLCGIRIREERIASDGDIAVLDEDYPIWVRSGDPWVWTFKIRDEGQRKNWELWERYLIDSIDWWIHRSAYPEKGARSYGVDMPPVWMSVPQVDKLRVSVAVYDRQGHDSEYIPVENLLGPENRETAIKNMGRHYPGFWQE